MAYQTIVAVFDKAAPAAAAVKALKAGGFADADISVFDSQRLAGDRGSKPDGLRQAGVWNRLFGGKVFEHEAAIYGQTVEKGGAILSVRVMDSEVAHATGILELNHPIDVHDRAITSGVATAAHVQTAAKAINTAPVAAQQTVAVPPKVAEKHADVLRLAEEQLDVGKRLVQTGKTRIRRFVTERPVSADVTLHEEHAEVLRRAITDPTYVGDIDWADNTIEVTETAEHALVKKTARIVEEVELRLSGSDHVETINDKIRRQQIAIERVGLDGKPAEKPAAAPLARSA